MLSGKVHVLVFYTLLNWKMHGETVKWNHMFRPVMAIIRFLQRLRRVYKSADWLHFPSSHILVNCVLGEQKFYQKRDLFSGEWQLNFVIWPIAHILLPTRLLMLMHLQQTIPHRYIQPSSWRWTLGFETFRIYQKLKIKILIWNLCILLVYNE